MSIAKPRIFLSYSRADRDFAVALRDELIAAGHAVWHDLKDMGAGQWWDQIAKQLRGSSSVEHIVLVVSPEALASRIVEREWRLARREGKTLSAVVPPAHKGRIDFAALPRWMSAEHHYHYAESDQRARLIADLKDPGQKPRRPDPLRKLPEAEGSVRRTTKVDEIKAALLDYRREAKVTTVVLSGAGGYGKSTLAIDIMNDPEIQDACYDGILWVELHEELVRIAKGPRGAEALRDAIKAKIETLIRDLTGSSEVLDDLDRAKERLGQLLANKHVLLVIDDAWDKSHANHFIEAAPEAAKLVTTRRTDIIGDAIIGVDQLSEDEALDLISLRLTPEPAATEKVLLRALALGRAGGWPLLLRLINGQLRLATTVRPGWSAKPLAKAVADLTATFDREGLKALDEETRDRAVRLSVGVSFEMLRDEDQHRDYPPGFHEARYLDLAGFQEAKVPIATIARLWAHLGTLKSKSVVLDAKDKTKRDAQEAAFRDAAVAESVAVLERLYALALLQSIDAAHNDGVVQLHDVMRTYLGELQSNEARNKFHRQFVLAYDADSDVCESAMGERERRYFYTWYPTHLAAADKADLDNSNQPRPFREALDNLLLNPQWIQRKLNALGNPQALVADYDAHAAGQMQTVIGRTLRLTAGILARDERQLLPQLYSRLIACTAPAATAFLSKARSLVKPSAMLTQQLSLTPPGAETARLEGHVGGVTSLVALPDGRLASGSFDKTIRLWDPRSGAETARLVGHSGAVTTLIIIPDGRLASGSADKTIRLWNPTTGAETARLEGHTDGVWALTMLPDGRMASGSEDDTIRIWDLKSGAETARLESDCVWVTALTVLQDGRLASGSWDNTIRLWDLNSGTESAQLVGHTSGVWTLAVLPDGRLASGSEDKTIRMWDPKSCTETARFEGHSDTTNILVVLPDGRLASGSNDNTIRIWDPQSGAEAVLFEGHSSLVKCLAMLPDGRLASGSYDGTIRLWDPQRGSETTECGIHRGLVKALAVLSKDRLVSGSWDETIRLWDTHSCAEISRLERHPGLITSLVVLPDGRLASNASDNTVLLWNLETAAQTMRLEGHSMGVWTLAVLPDGRLASGSEDNTIRLWDPMSGAETNQLKGHTKGVAALAVLQDGRLASGSWDNTIRLWDLKSGTESARLVGHTGGVWTLAVLPDGRLASGSEDKTIRMWDPKSCTETARLEGHSNWIRALTVLSCGRLASASGDNTIRLWDTSTDNEISRLEVDAPVWSLVALPGFNNQVGRLVAGDSIGRIHWLKIVD